MEEEICITCEEMESTRGEYCEDCYHQHQQDMHDDTQMDWCREEGI